MARSSVAHPAHLIKTLKRAFSHKGFSFVDAISICPVQYGRRNHFRTPAEMIQWLRKNSIPKEKAQTLPREDWRGKIVMGEFCTEGDRAWTGDLSV